MRRYGVLNQVSGSLDAQIVNYNLGFSISLTPDFSVGVTATLAELARRMLIFGMHVHIGIEDPELRIDVMNQSRYFVPHLLALSASSPLWHGRDTGLKSYRTVIFESLPRTGIPPILKSWADYDGFLDTLIGTGCIDEPTKIWWDVRPHPKFPTLEFRVCDIATKVDEAVCLAAVIQAIVAKLIKLRSKNQSWRYYRHHLITENKWRAVRYGVHGRLIDFGKRETGMTHDRAARPATCTVQAPHTPIPHPYLVPVSCRTSARVLTSSISRVIRSQR